MDLYLFQPPANDTKSEKKKSGRPKGSTVQAARVIDFQKEVLANKISTEWHDRVQLAGGTKMDRKELDALIKQRRKSSNLPDSNLKSNLSGKE